MKATATTTRARTEREWFASWFDSTHYHRLYSHRSAAEAAGFIDALIARRMLTGGAAVLDLGCGAGRHARYLASKGFDVTGLDLSEESLRLARPGESPTLRFVRQDMREPFGDGRFDHVVNLFTSFGYFDELDDHLTVVENIAASLKSGGNVVIDYLNVRNAEAHLVPAEAVERDGVSYQISRWVGGRHIFKRMVIREEAKAPVTVVERVARLGLADFRFMFGLCGLEMEAVHGDYALARFDEDASPRLIVIGRKGSAAGYRRDRFLRMRETVSGVMPRYEASMACGTRSAIDG
jgi:SAM-dependent methyltransferase